ncbi:hypothetical protein SynMVIR181_00899 [Synechococcus sp. MVIR-18-1]|nr:hypothetical protein SynMVIR181_00899 [Synechococcus sp. MVIR-18-1]
MLCDEPGGTEYWLVIALGVCNMLGSSRNGVQIMHSFR